MSTLVRPVFKPDIDFQVQVDTLEERTTIVHCTLTISCLLRISPSTYLRQDNGDKRGLVQAYHIVAAPSWAFALPNHCFTLVFEGLSRDCITFDLVEEITEPYPFHFTDIRRNGTDVYHLEYPNFPM